MLIFAAAERRRAHAKADLIEAVAFGYGGCQGKDGHRAMERMIDTLRRD